MELWEIFLTMAQQEQTVPATKQYFKVIFYLAKTVQLSSEGPILSWNSYKYCKITLNGRDTFGFFFYFYEVAFSSSHTYHFKRIFRPIKFNREIAKNLC